MEWIKGRFQEPSSYAALGGAVVGVGVLISQPMRKPRRHHRVQINVLKTAREAVGVVDGASRNAFIFAFDQRQFVKRLIGNAIKHHRVMPRALQILRQP